MSISGHDAAGNMLKDGAGVNTYTYAWDAEGRMKTVTPNGGSVTNFVYNALGQRVEKYTGSAYTEIAYDAFGNQIGTHNQTTWVNYFVPLGGRTLVRYQDGKTYFLHPNHLGTTTMVTDQTGATIQKTIYYPWGQTWASSATVKDSRFASMDPRDSETANDPTLFRMYQPRLYRWLSPDPLAGDISNPQSLNRYAYVLNNPTNFIDPLGLTDCHVTHNPEDCRPPTAGPPVAGGSPYGLGDAGSCQMDGLPVSCAMMESLVGGGMAAMCPNNACTGVNGLGLPVQYRATVQGGFYSCTVPGSWGSVNQAGIAAVACTNGQSIATNTEFGGNIYRMANGRYSFTQGVGGGPASVNIPTTVPNGTTIAGDYHTHGAYDPAFGLGNEIFSSGGPGTDIWGNNMSGLPGILGTPSGRIEVYDPSQAGQYPRGCVLVGTPVPTDPVVPNCQ